MGNQILTSRQQGSSSDLSDEHISKSRNKPPSFFSTGKRSQSKKSSKVYSGSSPNHSAVTVENLLNPRVSSEDEIIRNFLASDFEIYDGKKDEEINIKSERQAEIRSETNSIHEAEIKNQEELEDNSFKRICAWSDCDNVSTERRLCSRCLGVYYCSIDHQKKDYDFHKDFCHKKQDYFKNELGEEGVVNGHIVLNISTNGRGNVKLLNQALKSGANIDFKYHGGFTVLHLASQNENISLRYIKKLIDNQANLNALNDEGSSSLMFAAEKGRLDIVHLLSEHGAELNTVIENGESKGQTAFSLSCLHGHEKVASFFITKNVNINCQDLCEYSSLHWACIKGNISIVKALLDANINVHLLSSVNVTAWILNCVIEKSLSVTAQIARLFLDSGLIDVNETALNGDTALIIASFTNNIFLVDELLKESNINTEYKGPNGGTALTAAKAFKEKSMRAGGFSNLVARQMNLAICSKLTICRLNAANPSFVNPTINPWYEKPIDEWLPTDGIK
jgi:ankyrin repeat protein